MVRNIKRLKIVSLSTLFLMNSMLLAIKAQSQSNAPNLDGSQWQARIVWKSTETLSTSDFAEYDFGKQRKVTYKYISVAEISVISVVPKTNPLLSPDDPQAFEGTETKKRSHTSVRNTGGAGTYAQRGTMLHLDFPDHTIDASVKGKIMEGIITLKGRGERGLWDAERVPRTALKQPKSKDDNEQKYREFLAAAERLQNQRKYQEAIETYTSAINLNPNNGRTMIAYYQRGTSKFELQNYREAIADYDQFFTLYNKEEEKGGAITDSWVSGMRRLPNAYYYRGIAKDKLGNRVGACADLRESSRLGNDVAFRHSKNVCK